MHAVRASLAAARTWVAKLWFAFRAPALRAAATVGDVYVQLRAPRNARSARRQRRGATRSRARAGRRCRRCGSRGCEGCHLVRRKGGRAAERLGALTLPLYVVLQGAQPGAHGDNCLW